MISERKSKNKFAIVSLYLLLIFAFFTCAVGQGIPEPRREHTLNGLTVLLDNRPSEQNITLFLRVQSGSSFDPDNKGGTLAVMADLLFPDSTTHEFIADELKGKLETSVSYDSLDVVMSGHATEFERLVQFLRTALTGNSFTPEDFERVKAARLKNLKATQNTQSAIADLSIASRLYGQFPYGHTPSGTPESVANILIGDVVQARERFLYSNNAVLVVSGNINSERVMRGLRQLLGGWRKSDAKVPSSFRQAADPDERVLIVDAPGDPKAELRLAVRGVSRSDKDYYASQVLAEIIRRRWLIAEPGLSTAQLRVQSRAFVLPGDFTIGIAASKDQIGRLIADTQQTIQSLLAAPASNEEFVAAKSAAVGRFQSQIGNADGLAAVWLDAETYELPSLQSQIDSFNSVKSEDVLRVASRIFKKRPMAVIVAGNKDELTKALTADQKLKVQTAALPAPVKPIESRTIPAKP